MSIFLRLIMQFRFTTIWGVVSWVMLSLMTWVSNSSLMVWFWSQPGVDLGAKIWFLLTMYGALGSNHTLMSALLLILIALLTGFNVALLDRGTCEYDEVAARLIRSACGQ